MNRPVLFERRPDMRTHPSMAVAFFLAVLMAVITESLVPGAAIISLWLIWMLLHEPGEGVVLPVALSFQWLQVSIGVFYLPFTGSDLLWDHDVETDPMVFVGLLCVVTLALGIRLGKRLTQPHAESEPVPVRSRVSLRFVIGGYLFFLLSSDLLHRLAWRTGGLSQLVLTLLLVRFIFLYMLVARLSGLPMGLMRVGAVLVIELAAGLSGYFARFRESFVVVFLALLGTAHAIRTRHVVALGVLCVGAVSAAVIWSGVKQGYRETYDQSESRVDRISKIRSLAEEMLERRQQALSPVDAFVDRVWSVEYQAHALQRVPSVVPHENGRILWGALEHTFLPRAFFPNKGLPTHPSEMVRRYAGVWVAGEESGVSFAFGYAAEAYVDFGVPLMFVPVFVFGLVVGAAFGALQRFYRDRLLRAATLTTLFWVSLYLYERSWLRMIGLFVTWSIGLVIITGILDRLWTRPAAA